MPYIHSSRRLQLDANGPAAATLAKELCYLLTKELIAARRRGASGYAALSDCATEWLSKARSYDSVIEMIGALGVAGLEYERRTGSSIFSVIGMVAKDLYAQHAVELARGLMVKNGDVYDPDVAHV